MKIKKSYSFDDVLLTPNYSTVKSRSNVNLKVDMFGSTFIPIFSANMSTITEKDMVVAMNKLNCYPIIHRMTSEENVINILHDANIEIHTRKRNIGVSIGLDTPNETITKYIDCGATLLCLDIAHAHCKRAIEKTINIITYFREFPFIIGNISSLSALKDYWNILEDKNRLHENLAWKFSIGSGCFSPNTIITTDIGEKIITDITIGEYVLTHTGEFKKVISLFSKEESEYLYDINGVQCTKNHEFYVLNKKYINIISDDNLITYAEWISAENLTNDYVLIEKN